VQPEARAEEIHEPPPNWPDRGGIEFRNVTASHKLVSRYITTSPIFFIF
jgi:hypothetical protein